MEVPAKERHSSLIEHSIFIVDSSDTGTLRHHPCCPIDTDSNACGAEHGVSEIAWKIACALVKVSRATFQLAVESNFADEVVTDEFHAAIDISIAVQLGIV